MQFIVFSLITIDAELMLWYITITQIKTRSHFSYIAFASNAIIGL